MAIKTIKYKNTLYPEFQTYGFAAQFIIPFAKYVCRGIGYDIGCMKKEWSFPGSIPIDKRFLDEYNAYNLPFKNVDYIFSSHCLEHLPDWIKALDYWTHLLKRKGVLFLYLPHPDQIYWRPWNNRKHKHSLYPETIINYMKENKYKKIFNSERDFNHSYAIMGEKR